MLESGSYSDFVLDGDKGSEQFDLAFSDSELEENDFTALAAFVIANQRSSDWFFPFLEKKNLSQHDKINVKKLNLQITTLNIAIA